VEHRVLAAGAAFVEFGEVDEVRVTAVTYDVAEHLIELLKVVAVEDRRVEDDDVLLQVLVEDRLRVETVRQEDRHHVVRELE